jgi:hypothetical protein
MPPHSDLPGDSYAILNPAIRWYPGTPCWRRWATKCRCHRSSTESGKESKRGAPAGLSEDRQLIDTLF